VVASNRAFVDVTHKSNAVLCSGAGRFDQNPVTPMPNLVALATAKDLAGPDPRSTTCGLLGGEVVRGRSPVETTLRDANREFQATVATGGR
jgi:hypothetical protein